MTVISLLDHMDWMSNEQILHEWKCIRTLVTRPELCRVMWRAWLPFLDKPFLSALGARPARYECVDFFPSYRGFSYLEGFPSGELCSSCFRSSAFH